MPRLAAALIALLATGSAFAEESMDAAQRAQRFSETIRPFFTPTTTDRATLSPDGKYVAYTLHHGDTAYVMMLNVDDPSVKIPIAVSEDREGPAFARNKIRGRVVFLDWAAGQRLVFSSDLGEIFAIDADGRNLKKFADLNDFSAFGVNRRPRAVGFLGGDRNQLLIQASGIIPKHGVLSVGTFNTDVTTGKRVNLTNTDYRIGTEVLLDRQGRQRISQNTLLRDQDFEVVSRESDWKVRGKLAANFGSEQAEFWRVTPENYYSERAFPIAFDIDPNRLYFASNIGRDTHGLYALDLRTKQRTAFAVEHAHFDLAGVDGALKSPQLVFDRRTGELAGARIVGVRPTTHWLNADLAGTQSEVDTRFPSRFVQIIDWDDARERFLVQVSSASDPGRYYVYFRAERKMTEFLRLAPDLDVDALNVTKPFEFDTPAGIHLTGYLTQPSNARINPPPLLVYCHDGPNGRDLPRYNADVQALAAMGFVVAQVNYRGSDGFGRKHRATGLAAIERAPIEDMLAVTDWVASRQSIDRKRVALFGVGFGGYLALRALQLEPERFRCAVAINAPTDLSSWISYQQFTSDTLAINGVTADKASPPPSGGLAMKINPAPTPFDFQGAVRRVLFGSNAARIKELSPFHHPELIKRPVLLVQNNENPSIAAGSAIALRDALVREGVAAEFLRVDQEFDQRLPEASVLAFARIDEFFNLNVYDYGVKVGLPQPVK